MNRLSKVVFPVTALLGLFTATLHAHSPEREVRGVTVLTVTEIPDDGENSADDIMRRVIACAPYHLHRLSEYSAGVYLKSSYDVVKISRLVRGVWGKSLDNFREGDSYVQESVSEVEFSAPNKYEQRVVKQMTSMPDGLREVEAGTVALLNNMPEGLKGFEEGAMRLLNINVYDPNTFPAIISPLSPGAFTHYGFRHEGSENVGGVIVDKIKIVPIRKSQQLVSGHICVVRGEWNVHSLDIKGEMDLMARVDFSFKSDYGEVEGGIRMPIDHRVVFSARFLGNRGAMRYVASLRYDRVVENPSAREFALYADSVYSAVSVPERPLSNRDSYRLARRARRAIEAPGRRSLDISREFTENYKVAVDSLAPVPDPDFWDGARPMPLEPAELEGYSGRGITATAIEERPDTTAAARAPNIFQRFERSLAGKILTGDEPWKLGENGGELLWGGLIPSKLGFNTIDGFYFGLTPVSYRKTFSDPGGAILTISPEVGWAINRHVAIGDVVTRLEYAAMRRGELTLRAGSVSRNFTSGPGEGIFPFDNTVSSLVFRRGYLKLYGESFVELDNTIDIANGLALTLTMKYSSREGLENSSDFSFFYRKERQFEPNIRIPDHIAAIFTLGVEFTPRQYYRIRENGRKLPVRSDWPTFFVGWKKGVKGIGGSTTEFDHVSGGVRQNIPLGGPLHRLEYFLYGGFFASRKNLFFPDYRHFDAADIPVTNSSITSVGSYRMLGSYTYSTPDPYIAVHVAYRARSLLLKLLPWFRGRLWREGVQLHYLDTPALRNHMEIDYTIGLIWQAGIFIGVDEFRISRVGFKFSLPLRIPIRTIRAFT